MELVIATYKSVAELGRADDTRQIMDAVRDATLRYLDEVTLDTTLWREGLHAATMVGRIAAACKAVELGYGIGADMGRSGRLRHWRIARVPDEAIQVHSRRA